MLANFLGGGVRNQPCEVGTPRAILLKLRCIYPPGHNNFAAHNVHHQTVTLGRTDTLLLCFYSRIVAPAPKQTQGEGERERRRRKREPVFSVIYPATHPEPE